MATKITFTPVTPNGITTDYTEAETAQATLDAENALIESNHYVTKRLAEYPRIVDQLDMQYWDKINATSIWSDLITKIKSDNPKE